MSEVRRTDAVVDVLSELEWWLDLLAEADRVSRAMPAALRRPVEASAGRHELVRLAMHSATLSEETRRGMSATIARAIMLIKDGAGIHAMRPPGPPSALRPGPLAVVPNLS